MKITARRIVLETVGWILVLAGIAALVLPGPGLLLIVCGLAILAEQYPWAERRLHPLRDRAIQAAADGVRTVPRILMSLLSIAVMTTIGIIWGIKPDPPRWWPIDERWWLLGGWTTGATIIFSALVALGLLGYSWRKHRP